MNSIADGLVIIQSTPESVPSTPCWFGEVVLVATYLRQHGILTKISEQVRFARRRFGHYEVIDFVAVLLGYAISGECTLQMFYERLEPFAVPFMALFGRNRLPARSTLSRFLTALTASPLVPVARHVWQSRQWRIPQGVTPSGGNDPVSPAGAPVERFVCTAAA